MVNALTPAEFVAGAIICAGAAMLPDLDHPSATIAQTFGPVTWGLSKAVAWLSGGHRDATHSLAFAVAHGVRRPLSGQQLSDRPRHHGRAADRPVAAIDRDRHPGQEVASAVLNIGMTAGLFVVFRSENVGYAWLGLAVAIGCLIHVVGDC